MYILEGLSPPAAWRPPAPRRRPWCASPAALSAYFSRLARPSRGCFAANGSADAGLLPHALARHTGEPALLSVLAHLLVHAADPAPTRPAALPAPQACQGATC